MADANRIPLDTAVMGLLLLFELIALYYMTIDAYLL